MKKIKEDRAFSAGYLSEFQNLVARAFVLEPETIRIESDGRKKAKGQDAPEADLILPDGRKVLTRARRHTWLRAYMDQFTIRATRPSGIRTEAALIFDEHGADYLAYGFEREDRSGLQKWLIVDLKLLAVWYKQNPDYPTMLETHDEDKSVFLVFGRHPASSYPPGLIAATDDGKDVVAQPAPMTRTFSLFE